ncbi:poly-beta-1,6-N-acetyl-D-glucosamine biosynthesis protein PgaD [Pelosinus sp. sgz500959]|uniref:poly-beta-1,6-N-acetyl-D-glucosamine biosynthesis protein PgaD n=1 Tax=Pelosinus sp. sgz500959 TaxID=3242472 RepID=UPI00366C6856
MAYIPVTQLRKNRRKNRSMICRKRFFRCVIVLIGILSILLFPILSQPFISNGSTLLAVCILLLFGIIMISLTLRLVKKCNFWLAERKHAVKEIRKAQDERASGRKKEVMVIDRPRLQNAFIRGLESIFSISAWAFFLNLIQPFMTTILWWQGYNLMEGNAFSLATIEGTLIMIESSIYFGIFVFLILLSWSRWNYWRYGRLNRRGARPLVSTTDLAVFFDVPLATVQEAQSVKFAHVVVGPGFINFEKNSNYDMKKVCVYALLFLLLSFPSQGLAATFSTSMSVLGYDQDLVVTGAKTNLTLPFPVPKITPLAGSMVNLIIEPGRNVNDLSNFTFYMNDQQIATFSASQLRVKPNVQLPLPNDIVNKGQAQVGIVANVFATNDLCADYQRGYLFYTVRQSSALTMQFTPPAPKTIPEFFNTLGNGLVIIIPDNPTLSEMANGAWAYGILQKQYPHVPVKLIFANERNKYLTLPRIWIGLINHLPGALGSFTQGLHLPFPDTLVMAAEDDENLQGMTKQLAQLAVMEAVPSSNIYVSHQSQTQGLATPQERLHFGNRVAQEGILSVPVDFEIYPGMLSAIPKKMKFHLEGRYGPSNIVGKQVRLDVFLNRKLIHSELLDSSGVLNQDIILPSSQDFKAHNTLSVVFEYPDDHGYCKVKGMVQSVQILQSSYVSGIDKFSTNHFSWSNVGMLFNKKGLILLSDQSSPDLVRSLGEMVLLMDKQLPSGVFAYPSVNSVSQFSSKMTPDYLMMLGLAQDIPEEMQQALPLQRSKDYTLYREDGGTVAYRYQAVGNTILGQIGDYHGIPLISVSANMQLQSLPNAIRNLQNSRTYDELAGNIFIVNEQNQISSFSNRPLDSHEEDSRYSWMVPITTLFDKMIGFAEQYQRPILLALGISAFIVIGKMMFTSRKKKKK